MFIDRQPPRAADTRSSEGPAKFYLRAGSTREIEKWLKEGVLPLAYEQESKMGQDIEWGGTKLMLWDRRAGCLQGPFDLQPARQDKGEGQGKKGKRGKGRANDVDWRRVRFECTGEVRRLKMGPGATKMVQRASAK